VTAAQRLDGVDLRVGIPDADTARAAAAFGLDPFEARERQVYLLEYLPGGAGLLAGADATAWLARAPGRHEVVVRLRPARRSRLAPAWSAFYADSSHRLRIAQEWVGTRRILTASLAMSPGPAGPVPGSATDPERDRPGRGLLSARQRHFLADGARLAVPDNGLVLFGPIREQAWALDRGDLGFQVRRWTARRPDETAGLDLIDLEAPTSEADAPFLFPVLRSLAQRHGVDPGGDLSPLAIRALAWFLEHRR